MATVEKHPQTSYPDLRRQVAEVSGIRLTGAPRALVVDTWAIVSPEGNVPSALSAKLAVLAREEGMQVVVISKRPEEMREALRDVPNLQVVSTAGDARMDGPALAILAERTALPAQTYVWFVGEGSAEPPFHGTRHQCIAAADEILGLFGTALVQERAGIAFRAAGAGRAIPHQERFDSRILDGIAEAVASHPDRVERLEESRREGEEVDLDRATDRLISAALPPILASQSPNGAIAAAPPPTGPDQPNYWFFWQRDAGQVVIAMAELSRSAAEGRLREEAGRLVASYVDFVERLPHGPGMRAAGLAVSRFEMDGRPIVSYGNPQMDGPAQTVLAVLAALGETKRTFEVCTPYLECLSERMFEPSFDPWEFAVGRIFYDYNLARRALRAGTRLAQAQGEGPAARRFERAADRLEEALDAFRSPAAGYLPAGREYLQPFLDTISHLDVAVVGSVLTAYDVDDPCLNVEDPLVHGTVKALERVFAERWPVNVAWQRGGRAGMGMGRFPEDANDGIGSTGGNPWTFATLWAAQYYLRLAERHRLLGTESVAPRTGEWLEKADGYLHFVLSHGSPAALTEQIDGRTGKPRGAAGLAWAQASLVQTLLLRRKLRAMPER